MRFARRAAVTKKRITPEVRITTNDFPDIMRREFSLAYTFEIHESHDMKEFLYVNYSDVLSCLERKLNDLIREWAHDEC